MHVHVGVWTCQAVKLVATSAKKEKSRKLRKLGMRLIPMHTPPQMRPQSLQIHVTLSHQIGRTDHAQNMIVLRSWQHICMQYEADTDDIAHAANGLPQRVLAGLIRRAA